MQNASADSLTTEEEPSDQQQPAIMQADFQQLSTGSEKHEKRNIDLLLDVELPISIELGRTRMHISDILSLGPGSIVELDKLVGEPVDLLVNQKKVARGEVVVVEENFGLRITHLISPEERAKMNPRGYLYMKKVVFTQLREMGVPEATLDRLCVNGPRNFFEGS